MTDLHERAKQVAKEWFENCRPTLTNGECEALETYIAAALKQVREEDPKERDDYRAALLSILDFCQKNN